MTNGEIFKRFQDNYKERPKVDDYRPIEEMYTEDLEDKPGIRLWMDNGDSIMYFPKEESTCKEADIIFLPVCSNCGEVIKDEIDFKKTDDPIPYIDNKIYVPFERPSIYPAMCPKCKAFFNSIIINYKLPFDNSNWEPEDKQLRMIKK